MQGKPSEQQQAQRMHAVRQAGTESETSGHFKQVAGKNLVTFLQTLQQSAQFFGLPGGGGLPPAGHTQRNQANPTAGGPTESLTSEIHSTPLSQGVPSAQTKVAWESAQFHACMCTAAGALLSLQDT